MIRIQALNLLDPPGPLLAVAQLDSHIAKGIAQLAQATLHVIVEEDAVVIAISQLAQAQMRRVARCGFEQPIQPVDTFNQQVAASMAPHAQPFAGAEHRSTRRDHAHVDPASLFIGVDQPFATVGM